MHLMYFTEQPMSAWDPESAALDEVAIGGGKSQRVTALLHSNRHFDPVAGGRLYNERLDEYQLVEEVGFDGIMLNEHHTAPFCMSPRVNLFATLLARITKKVKIVLLGNPLPIWDNPVHLAEELAIIDMISGGRLVSGFVRGGGVENIQANVNPLFNRERFEEAHDLLIKAWTTPGPFRWEGKHYQFRVVNPWATPVQKPFPRIWIPGVASKETVIWAAKHGYPYLGLNTNFDLSQKIKDIYTESAREVGYEPGPEHFGQLLQCHVADTEEKAERNAKEFMWMRGEFTGLAHPVWGSPTGYGSPSNRKSLHRDRGRAPADAGGPADQPAAARAHLRLGYPGPGDHPAQARDGQQPRGDPRPLGQRRPHRPPGLVALHRTARQGGPARSARLREATRPQRPVRKERAGECRAARHSGGRRLLSWSVPESA